MALSHRSRSPYLCSMPASFEPADFAAGVPGSAATPEVPASAARMYINPVLDADFPDPAVIQASDGYYYAYATQTLLNGRWINIQVARSADLIHWDHLGDALPEKPG